MRTTQQFSVTVPFEMAEMIKAKVASGEYVSESEVMRDGLRSLLARDKAVEKWLVEVAVPAALEMQANPSLGISLEEIKKTLSEHASARKLANGL
jgi:antitoxin ParD1/3/4